MAEALMAARQVDSGINFPDDGLSDKAWRIARGHIIDVKPDNWIWQKEEDPRLYPSASLRKFALIRFPSVSVARIQKYMVKQVDQFVPTLIIRERLWQIQWNSLPAVARNIVIATGVLTIGPTGDFTWPQVQAFFVRLDTGQGDTETM